MRCLKIRKLNCLLLILYIAFVIQLLGCSGKNSNLNTKKDSEYTEQEKFGGILKIAQGADPQTFDPCSMWDVSSHGTLSAILYNGLVKFDMDGNIVPDLAEKWDISSDGKTYTFYLRKNVKFHNGDPLMAHDIEFCYKRFLAEPKAYYKWLLDKLVGSKEFMKNVSDYVSKQNPPVTVVQAIDKFPLPGLVVKDDYTIQLTLANPYAPFIKGLGMPEAYIANPRAVKELGKGYAQHPVGTGPFKLKDWVQNGKVSFEANPDYFEGKPYLDGIDVSIIEEESSIYQTYKSGAIDTMLIPDTQFKKTINDPNMKPYVISRPELSIHCLGMGFERKIISDKRVRQAINYAVNRKQMLETLYNGRGTLATGPVPIGLPDYKSTIESLPYDPAKAKQLLTESGYPNGFKMKIWIDKSNMSLEIVQAIQADLKRVGIEAEIIQNEWSTLHKAVLEGSTDATYPWVWSADYADAEDFLYPIYHSRNIPEGGNSGRYKNPQVDKILDQAHEETDPKKVIELLHQAESLIVADYPKVYLWYPVTYAMHQPWVHNYKLPAIYNADKMNKIWLNRQ